MRSSSPANFDIWEAVDGLRETFAPRRTGRMGRGDIRAAILVSLAEAPMHGYQIIQAIEARTRGAWKPSAGSIYPTLQLLADEELVTAEQVGERKVYSLTEAGAKAAEAVDDMPESGQQRHPWHNEAHVALPKAGAKLAQALAQVAQSGTDEQRERAVVMIDETRRKLYAILAED